MKDFLSKVSQFFYNHVGVVRWWFNSSLAAKLIIAFIINASVTLASGGMIYYLVKTGRQVEQNMGLFLVLMVVASLLIILYGLYIAYLTSTPLRESVRFAEAVAKGDLSPSLTTLTQKDEIGLLCTSLNTMVQNFRVLVGNISHGSDVFAESSQQLASRAETTTHAAQQVSMAINQVASGSQTQANSVQSILQTIENMNLIIMQIENSVGLADNASSQALNVAGEGEKAILRTATQMNQIQQTVKETGDIISELGEKSAHIGTIVETIKAISDQTNLLALNAAIEAARAGEHGRGFSVVADEVRKLAEQSTTSSAEIEQIIQDIKINVSKAIFSMNAETEVVIEGSKIITESQKAFARISESTRIVNEQIQDVATYTKNITVSSQQITQEINQVASITQETTAQTQEVASSSSSQMESMQDINASAEQLSSAAAELQATAKKFKLVK